MPKRTEKDLIGEMELAAYEEMLERFVLRLSQIAAAIREHGGGGGS